MLRGVKNFIMAPRGSRLGQKERGGGEKTREKACYDRGERKFSCGVLPY